MAAREQPPDAYRSDALLTTRQRVDQNSLQAFCKRFSGHERTQMSDRQGADARRDATSGHFVCLCCPGAGALHPVIQVRVLEGQLTADSQHATPMPRL